MRPLKLCHLMESRVKYLVLCFTFILRTETKDLTVEEVRCQVNQAHDYLHTAIDLLKTAQSKLPEDIHIIVKSPGIVELNRTAQQCQSKPLDCDEIYKHGDRKDGIYKIWPRSRILDGPIDVYCDMESDFHGWTVIQRRGDFRSPDDYFYKDWDSYKNGFGELDKDFWLGNDKLFVLSNQKNYTLRIDIGDWEGISKYAEYENFWVDNVQQNYTLHVGAYNGTAGDCLYYQNGSKFSTKDRDNDPDYRHCASSFKGGWWYSTCHYANLNGFYYREKHTTSSEDGIHWRKFHGAQYSHKDVVMKIRSIH